jgi:hypothetical protein
MNIICSNITQIDSYVKYLISTVNLVKIMMIHVKLILS